MKQTLLLKNLFLLIFLSVAFNSIGQIHPLAFGGTNWYRNYVGLRFEVTAPAIIVGDKQYTTANDGSGGSGVWGGIVTAPLINKLIIMPPSGDSLCGTPIPAGSMTGKIALVYRGGGIEFSAKALAAQNAGAIACVIVNNVSGAPVGMNIGSFGGSVTIPVFMVSQADGNAMDMQYNLGVIPTMTITPWGQGFRNDLGFVPQGIAGWHDFAIPYNQLFSSGNPMAYKGMDGAFIANYGTSNAKNVKVSDTLRYTPTGLGASIIHTDVSPTLATFTGTAHLPTPDSIYAMIAPSEYNFAPTGSGTGRFDLKYTISSDTADLYPADNTATFSFYTTDSLYSKGQYDFTNNVPESATYLGTSGGNDFLWGPTYFVAHGGAAISTVQFSIAAPAPGPIGLTSMNVYAFKWVDGSGGQPLDSLLQNGELTLVSLGVYTFLGTDTSFGVFKVQMGDPITGIPGAPILLDSNAWYYIAVEVPGGYFLGCDGQHSPYPRTYSRFKGSSGLIMDYNSVCWFGDYNSGINPMTAVPNQGNPPNPFPVTSYINHVDSFNYSGQKGVIPAVALIVDNYPNYIIGTAEVCVAATTTLSDPKPGGAWSSATTTVATISSTGIVTGVSAGTSVISYTVLGNTATKIVTVDPLPVAGTITGGSSICGIGASITLSDATLGGTWHSATTTVATVSSGVVTSVSAGTDVISYTVTNSCGSATATKTITVDITPAAGTITGPSAVCIGLSATLTDAVGGGVWSSSNTSVATAGSAGTITGVSSGTAVISYTVTNSCGSATATHSVAVSAAPVAGTITGGTIVCIGATINLSDAAGGGVWSSVSTSVATIGSSGVVTGVSSGTSVISYTVTNSCGSVAATSTVTVSPVAVAGTITGLSSVCTGSTISLTDAIAGGVWSSSSTANATVTSSGVITGVSPGTASISYTVTNSCSSASASKVITINPSPSAGTITGAATTVCVSSTLALTDAAGSGSWTASNGSALVSGVGAVLGVATGIDTIIYTVTNICGTATTTDIITVNDVPDAGTIGGLDTVCVGGIITLTETATSGSWSASNANAFVSSTGDINGLVAGVDTIYYSATNTCGTSSAQMLINVSDCISGVKNVSAIAGNVVIYPNPTHNTVTITATETIHKLVIDNLLGQEVFSGTYNSNEISISLSQLPDGVYVLKVNDSMFFKVVKE